MRTTYTKYLPSCQLTCNLAWTDTKYITLALKPPFLTVEKQRHEDRTTCSLRDFIDKIGPKMKANVITTKCSLFCIPSQESTATRAMAFSDWPRDGVISWFSNFFSHSDVNLDSLVIKLIKLDRTFRKCFSTISAENGTIVEVKSTRSPFYKNGS